MALSDLYRPAQDEAAKHAFVGSLKAHLNGRFERRLADLYAQSLAPAFEAEHGRAPSSRDEARALLTAHPLFQLWGSLLYTSQDLLWETSGETVDRLRAAFDAEVSRLADGEGALGSLTLDPDMPLPQPIADIEIHRQPGGYFHQDGPRDVTAAVLYLGAVDTYRAAKRLSGPGKAGDPTVGRFIAALARKLAPGLEPLRILDLGCGNGTQTVAYAEAWPQAELHGADLSAPFLRFAHAWAEGLGVAVHYHQMDAGRMTFPDGHFDLIVSHILCHETWDDILRRSLAQSYRMLRPGGMLLHVDVPYQPDRMSLTGQVCNEWQIVNNGEPYWMGFSDTPMRPLLLEAGFGAAEVIEHYEPFGQGAMYAFGGIKSA